MRVRTQTRFAAITVALAIAVGGCSHDDSSPSAGAGASSSGGSSGASTNKIDACAIVTESDATQVFGRAAKKDTTSGVVVDPAFLGECHWTYEEEDPSTGAVASETVSFYVWKGAQYYSKSPGSEDFAVGEGGCIHVDKMSGIDVEWVQHDTTLVLSYFTIGLGIDPSTKTEAMKSLATSASAKLEGPS